jgi:hypothetical protein
MGSDPHGDGGHDARGCLELMRNEDEHPAAPEQVEHGFDEGVGKRPRPPSKRRVGRFSEGVEHDSEAPLRRGRFSEGVEQRPESPDKTAERRFSEGVEGLAEPNDRE